MEYQPIGAAALTRMVPKGANCQNNSGMAYMPQSLADGCAGRWPKTIRGQVGSGGRWLDRQEVHCRAEWRGGGGGGRRVRDKPAPHSYRPFLGRISIPIPSLNHPTGTNNSSHLFKANLFGNRLVTFNRPPLTPPPFGRSTPPTPQCALGEGFTPRGKGANRKKSCFFWDTPPPLGPRGEGIDK